MGQRPFWQYDWRSFVVAGANLMSRFENVAVTREANVYFDGKVTSRTVHFPDGSRKTLGVMLPGEYEFGTDSHELMEIMSGELEIQLPGQPWRKIGAGDAFEVAANARFSLKIHAVTDYCCSYS